MALFISFLSTTSHLAFADNASYAIKNQTLNLALNQVDSKNISTSSSKLDSDEIVANLNVVKMKQAIVQPKDNNSDQSLWLLVFALFGFVMLSNRRGV